MGLFRKSKIKARRFAIIQAMTRARIGALNGLNLEEIVERALVRHCDVQRGAGESILDMTARSRGLDGEDLRAVLRALRDDGLDPERVKYLGIGRDIFVQTAGVLMVLLDDEARLSSSANSQAAA
ncbi:MAG: hypothetical protein ABI824_19215 [Acidobacteriota bacterium]